MAELAILLPGFGDPHRVHKCDILENNLRVLGYLKDTNLFQRVYLTVCIYDEQTSTLEAVAEILNRFIKMHGGFFNVQVMFHKGIVGQFIHEHLNPTRLNASVDYVMILLDDVELKGEWSATRWCDVFYDINYHRLDVFSPSLSADSKCLFRYMRQRVGLGCDMVSLTSACELFCYILPRHAFERYYAEITPTHPWMWGIDLVLTKHLHFRVGISHYLAMRHHYQSTPNMSETSIAAFEAMKGYLAKFGETQESLAVQPAVLQDVYIYHRVSV